MSATFLPSSSNALTFLRLSVSSSSVGFSAGYSLPSAPLIFPPSDNSDAGIPLHQFLTVFSSTPNHSAICLCDRPSFLSSIALSIFFSRGISFLRELLLCAISNFSVCAVAQVEKFRTVNKSCYIFLLTVLQILFLLRLKGLG